jgi:hypothetical protein
VRQLSESVCVLYLSNQGEEATGFPKRTTEAFEFLRLEVGKIEINKVTQTSLTDASLSRLVFAAQRYYTIWKKNRKDILKGQEQNEDAKEQFINYMFKNHDQFGAQLPNDWNKSKLSLTQSSSAVASINDSKDRKSFLFVVAFDEARELLLCERDPKKAFSWR